MNVCKTAIRWLYFLFDLVFIKKVIKLIFLKKIEIKSELVLVWFGYFKKKPFQTGWLNFFRFSYSCFGLSLVWFFFCFKLIKPNWSVFLWFDIFNFFFSFLNLISFFGFLFTSRHKLF